MSLLAMGSLAGKAVVPGGQRLLASQGCLRCPFMAEQHTGVKQMGGDVPPLLLGTRDGYDRWSDIYDVEDNALIALESRHFDHLLGDASGCSIADIGCGTGRHAIRLAAKGARVTALDFSEGMLKKAREKAGAHAVRFLAHDFAKPIPLESGEFDREICALVLDHIEDVEGLLKECGRICSSLGFVLVTVMRPAMMLRGIQARFVDPGTNREMRPQSVANEIGDYVMGALRADLEIEYMGEHVVDEALADPSPGAQKYLGWPLFGDEAEARPTT